MKCFIILIITLLITGCSSKNIDTPENSFVQSIGTFLFVSLVFTGIAVNTLTAIDFSLASIVSGTIVAAAIINEIIAVIVAKFAFKWAGEIS